MKLPEETFEEILDYLRARGLGSQDMIWLLLAKALKELKDGH